MNNEIHARFTKKLRRVLIKEIFTSDLFVLLVALRKYLITPLIRIVTIDIILVGRAKEDFLTLVGFSFVIRFIVQQILNHFRAIVEEDHIYRYC